MNSHTVLMRAELQLDLESFFSDPTPADILSSQGNLELYDQATRIISIG